MSEGSVLTPRDERAVSWTSMEDAWLTPQTTREQDRFRKMNEDYLFAFKRDVLPHIADKRPWSAEAALASRGEASSTQQGGDQT